MHNINIISFIFVLADDHRVVLRREGEGNDFINASYIAVGFTCCLFYSRLLNG